MKRPTNWNLIYAAALIMSLFLFVIGQWSAGLICAILTLSLSRLVLIEKHMAIIAYTPVDPVDEQETV